MRVSSSQIYDILIKYDRQRSFELTRRTEELSSGKSILSPSDAPVDFARSLRLSKLSEKLDRLSKNIDVVTTYLDTAESTLGSAIDTLQGARVKIVQLLNTGTITEDEAKALGDYFKSVRDYIIQLGNQRVGDDYIFGGMRNQAPPFNQNGEYGGLKEPNTTKVPVASGVKVETNFDGSNYFAVNSETNRILSVEVLDKVIEIINSGDLSRLHTETLNVNLGDGVKSMKLLEAFDGALSKMMAFRSKLGTVQGVVDDLKVQNRAMGLRLRELNSKLTDVDYSEAIAKYQKAKTAYEALLAAITNVQNISILNFLK